MEITVTINAPDLANAIRTLAVSLSSQNGGHGFGAVITEAIKPFGEAQPGPVNSIPLAAPAAMPSQLSPVPVQAPLQQAAPAAPMLAQVPTAVQTYTMEQLAVAATQLVDAGRRAELVSLLASFGVQALTSLPKEQYGAFATQLRTMGAKI